MYPEDQQYRTGADSKRPNPGKPFEGIVATLERVLAGSPTAKIESNKEPKDKVGHGMKEHDVILTTTVPPGSPDAVQPTSVPNTDL